MRKKYLVKLIFKINILWSFFSFSVANAQLIGPTAEISAGYNNACAIVRSEITCWGKTPSGILEVPPTSQPALLSAEGGNHACVLDDNSEVICWGSGFSSDSEMPSFDNPVLVDTGTNHSCALDNEGVKCWGQNRYGQIAVPDLENPTMVSAGHLITCAIDDNGVDCWGNNSWGVTANEPTLVNPRIVTAGANFACALDDNGVSCWGASQFTRVPELSNPVTIDAGLNHACALDEDGVSCWGINSFGQTDVPSLTRPSSVSAGYDFTCAIDQESVICWGINNKGQTDVPEILPSTEPPPPSEGSHCDVQNSLVSSVFEELVFEENERIRIVCKVSLLDRRVEELTTRAYCSTGKDLIDAGYSITSDNRWFPRRLFTQVIKDRWQSVLTLKRIDVNTVDGISFEHSIYCSK